MIMSKQSRNEIRINPNLLAVVFAALIIFMGNASLVDALGVSPGRTTLNFEPGLEKSVTFTITNNELKEFNAFVYVEGDLKDYITFDNEVVKFNETIKSRSFKYSIRLPDRIDTPGDNWGKIVIMELPKGWEGPEGETSVVATVGVIHQLKIKVPYPGKFLQTDLKIQAGAQNEEVNFFTRIFNLGKDDVASAKATLEIFGPDNNVVETIETASKPVKSMTREELIATWTADVEPGSYKARTTIVYDGETSVAEKRFYIGDMNIDIIDVDVRDFRLGGIAKFDIFSESKWNQPIKGVYAQMAVDDKENKRVADFKSASVDFESFEKKHLFAYWDTEGIQEGDYKTTLTLHYSDRTTEKIMDTRVGLESIRTDIVGGVGAVTGEDDLLSQSPIILLVSVLIAINLGWFLYFRKRKK